ncbi:OLC1v1022955C2 [Oldenlandia corymbosa var. corymbosa]|uniref:OLC1v1022955C2 n=1 Tax=Oldenlandia corymbosa var. corymbosa TaxID=529605 RepID=A0AAV1C0I9_OLDCO|nr:OLC1v1022955C2 [Oldenlandia corymbosa var. corymbosa]
MAAWVAARKVANLTRLSASGSAPSTRQAASLLQRRGLAGGGDHHGPPKVNFWEDPMSPSKWKEEHFVIVSLAGWGLAITGAYKFFTGGKKDTKDEKVAESH